METLIGLLIVVIASIGTLMYFSHGLGGVRKQGDRRAALEIARQRLEQLMSANLPSTSPLRPPDTNPWWVTCSGSPCTWTRFASQTTESVTVDTLANLPMATTVQWVDDPASAGTQNALEFSIRVWFRVNPNLTNDDNDANRVLLKTLRKPS